MSGIDDDKYRFSYAKRKAANSSGAARRTAANESRQRKAKGDTGPPEDEGKQFVFSSKVIDDVLRKANEGFALKRQENPWFKNQAGVRRPNAVFSLTQEELMEYARCKMSVHYFAEGYCKIKGEDGSIGPMKLRDYQKGIVDLYTKNRFAILMASRQTGKCVSGDAVVHVRSRASSRSKWAERRVSLRDLSSEYMGAEHGSGVREWNGDPATKVAKMCFTYENELQVETLTGWTPVEEIAITHRMKAVKVFTDKGALRCAEDHLLFTPDGWKGAKDLREGDMLVSAAGDWAEVENVFRVSGTEPMYDLTTGTADYFADGLLSHNTVSAAIVLTHYVSFNNDKGIMIVANKASTVIEIVDKIKSIYKLVPYYLKPGVVNWAQRTLIFDNGCRIKTEARTKEPSIGFTIDFLYLDEFAHIPKNIIEHYYRSVVPTVSSIQNSKIVITSTPNGKNLFYTLMEGAEKKKGEPGKNNYTGLRVYWYQVPGRLDTKVYFDEQRLERAGVTIDFALSLLRSMGHTMYERKEATDAGTLTAWCIKHDPAQMTVDTVQENLEEMKAIELEVPDAEGMVKLSDIKAKTVKLADLADITNWQEQETQLLGGSVEAFNQEYNLRFIAGSKMLYDASVDFRVSSRKRTFEWTELPALEARLPFDYDDLTWTPDKQLFDPLRARAEGAQFVVTVDLAEGLKRDYSVLNIFKVVARDMNDVGAYGIKELHDAFCLVQVGTYRTNHLSIEHFAEAAYLILFELLDPERMKVIVEWNNYGALFLNHMKDAQQGQNEYGTYVFQRYKHRADADERKIGLRLNANKNVYVKDYAERVSKDSVVLFDEATILEMQNFVKHESGGSVQYKAETGHDDLVMTVVAACSIFNTVDWKNMCSMAYDDSAAEVRKLIDAAMRVSENTEAPNYTAVRQALNAHRNGTGLQRRASPQPLPRNGARMTMP